MDASSPIKSVIPTVRGDVLRVLALTDDTLTGRQVADLVGSAASRRAVSIALNDLVAAGIVHRQEKGSAYLHVLNREHLAADAIVALASMRDRLLDAMETEVAAWHIQPAGMWLFGSMARGDGSSASDVDVLVVRPESVLDDDAVWESQIDELAANVTAWTGNDCREIEYSTREIRDLVAEGEPLVALIRQHGILIAGDRSLLRQPSAGLVGP
jgi:predicted nucleotidyltransferase